jgi:hypothetical protein
MKKLFFLLLILIILTSGCTFSKDKATILSNSPTPTPTVKTSIPTISPTLTTLTPTPTPIITEESWATYKNQNWEFSIQYPNDWTPRELYFVGKSDPNTVLAETFTLTNSDKNVSVDVHIYKPDKSLEQSVDKWIQEQLNGYLKDDNIVLREKKKITLSGYPALKVVLTHDEVVIDKPKTGRYFIETIYMISTLNHSYYIFAGYTDSETTNKYQTDLNRIVNSFTIIT